MVSPNGIRQTSWEVINSGIYGGNKDIKKQLFCIKKTKLCRGYEREVLMNDGTLQANDHKLFTKNTTALTQQFIQINRSDLPNNYMQIRTNLCDEAVEGDKVVGRACQNIDAQQWMFVHIEMSS